MGAGHCKDATKCYSQQKCGDQGDSCTESLRIACVVAMGGKMGAMTVWGGGLAKKRVLYVVHGHPSIAPGGTEVHTHELFEAMREAGEFEPLLLARVGSMGNDQHWHHSDTPFGTVNGEQGQYFFYTDIRDFNWLLGTLNDKVPYIRDFRKFLLAHRPDVVHFQHTALLGYELLRETRNALPHAPILYTLHEFAPICHRDGQMVRTRDQELCQKESPFRCHQCFPDISSQSFFLRKRFIQSHLSLVDLFLAPSHYLLEQYVAWGIPREKMRYEENGRHVDGRVDHEGYLETDRARDRFGFFGVLTSFKGVDVLLEAMRLLDQVSDAHLSLHGGGLERQPVAYQTKVLAMIEAAGRNVTMVGPYSRPELHRRMAEVDWVVVPSIWWENSPLVIQEAFLHGRPVICSDIGGMAEKVDDGVSGLHFRARDPHSLAQTIRRAAETPGLWEHLRRGIPAVYWIKDQAAHLAETYRALLGRAIAIPSANGAEAGEGVDPAVGHQPLERVHATGPDGLQPLGPPTPAPHAAAVP